MHKLEKMKALCQEAHKGQKRSNGLEYSTHLNRVTNYLAQETTNEDWLCIAYGHDLLEDTTVNLSTIQEQFGYVVANGILQLTNSWSDHSDHKAKLKLTYEHARKMDDHIKAIKLIDRYDNLTDMKSFSDGRKLRFKENTFALLGGMMPLPDAESNSGAICRKYISLILPLISSIYRK